jgi:hypothetical protein
MFVVTVIRNAQFCLYNRDSVVLFSSYTTKLWASAVTTLYYVCMYGYALQLVKKIKDCHINLH